MSVHSSAVLTDPADQVLRDHLLRPDGQEDICFALYNSADGQFRRTAQIFEVILPLPGDRQVHGNASINPQYVERAISEAIRRDCGLALLHSHPLGLGWQRMSRDDVTAESSLAPAITGATSLPLLGLTLAGDGHWSCRYWDRVGFRQYAPTWCSTIRVIGERFEIYFNDELIPPPMSNRRQIRTVSAWGEPTQAKIVRLRIGIVGVGSVGAIVAESLTRMGVREIITIDHDSIEEHNLDRLSYARNCDVGAPKVVRLHEHLTSIATADDFENPHFAQKLSEKEALAAALDCDILFSCVDRPWPRHLLNQIAFSHNIPVIDGGIAIRTTKTYNLAAADWRTHIVAPGRICLKCLGQYSLESVQADREGLLDDPLYIAGLPQGHPYKFRQNVHPFALNCAGREMLQFLAYIVAPTGWNDIGAEHYHFVGDFWEMSNVATCDHGCNFAAMTGLGAKHPIL